MAAVRPALYDAGGPDTLPGRGGVWVIAYVVCACGFSLGVLDVRIVPSACPVCGGRLSTICPSCGAPLGNLLGECAACATHSPAARAAEP
jgi:hypothetical protein